MHWYAESHMDDFVPPLNLAKVSRTEEMVGKHSDSVASSFFDQTLRLLLIFVVSLPAVTIQRRRLFKGSYYKE